MHSRRIACFLLGLWLAGGFFMAWVAWQNRAAVDRLLAQPHPAALLQFKGMGPVAARLLVAWQSEEQTRFYYESWETFQILLGAFLFLFLLFGSHEDKYSLLAALLLIAVTAAQRFWLTPQIVSLGRVSDFVPETVRSLERVKLHVLRTGYSVSEVAKGAIALGFTLRLVVGSRRSSSSQDVRQKLDLIDKANYRHIDR